MNDLMYKLQTRSLSLFGSPCMTVYTVQVKLYFSLKNPIKTKSFELFVLRNII